MANPKQEIKYTKLFIDNEFVDAKSGKTIPIINPSNEAILAHVAEADKVDVDLAVQAAKRAFARGSTWRNMDASARGFLINKLADLIERDINILVNIEALDTGKTYENSRMDLISTISTIRYYAGYADKIHGHTIPADGNVFGMTRREPIGVVGQIIPWNFPMMMLAWKWGPALAAGCPIVLKPAEQAPLSTLHVAALTKEAGFPNGVINVVPGYGPTAGHAISSHMDIAKVAFTGSTLVGRLIMEDAAKSNLKKVSLELGGKSAVVIFDDAEDLDEAVKIANMGAFFNHGQNCSAGSRTFVQEGIYDKFVKKAVEMAKNMKVGDQFEKDVVQGPQINENIFNRIMGYIELGKSEGARIETGGKRIGNKGYFIEPTVFTQVTDDMKISQEEIFGPVQSILKFKTLDEVIERANKSTYGLGSGCVTKSIDTALTFAQAMESGSVWINIYDYIAPQLPFGGYKESGHGRELGEDSLNLYLETKTITIKVPTKN